MRARVFVLLALCSLIGCAGLLGFDDFVAGKAAPDGGEAGPAEGGPPDGEEANADWYVSLMGDDASDGSRAHPFASLTKAAARAQAALAIKAPQRIAICEGEYKLALLTLTGAIEVFGGYDCGTWQRPVRTDSAIGATTSPTPTKLVNDGPANALISLEPEASRAPRLDGLTLRGTDVPIVISSIGDTVLTELTVENRTAPSSSRPVTIGISLSDSSEGARIEHCTVEVAPSSPETGGANVAVAGIGLANSHHLVRRNSIGVFNVNGGCVGISVQRESALTITENVVPIGACVVPTKDLVSMNGLNVHDAEVRSVRNVFVFEAPGNGDPTAPTIVYGIATKFTPNGARKVESDGDRIVGPTDLSAKAFESRLFFRGFMDSAGSLARVVNASIVLDSREYRLDSSAGIYFAEPTSAVVAHNSMYFAKSGNSTTDAVVPMRGVVLSNRALAIANASALTLESNLVVSDEPRMAFVYASCEIPGIAALAHNRFAGFDAPVAAPPDDCTGPLEQLWPDAGADGNIALTCPADGGCATLFASVSKATDGLRLADAGCAFAVGVPSRTVTTDGSGKPRGDAGTAAGAFECD